MQLKKEICLHIKYVLNWTFTWKCQSCCIASTMAGNVCAIASVIDHKCECAFCESSDHPDERCSAVRVQWASSIIAMLMHKMNVRVQKLPADWYGRVVRGLVFQFELRYISRLNRAWVEWHGAICKFHLNMMDFATAINSKHTHGGRERMHFPRPTRSLQSTVCAYTIEQT